MKFKLLLVSLALGISTILSAQTAEEILQRMDAEMDKIDASGVIFDMNMSIPILGKVKAHNYILGDLLRTEITGKGELQIVWRDNDNTWTYTPSKNEVKITKSTPSSSKESDNLEQFSGITEGYDVKLDKQTAQAWYLTCKKSKTNKDKDDPKKMSLIIAKDTYLPISLSTKAGLIGISMENFKLGVTRADVTFDPAAYPGVTIIDER